MIRTITVAVGPNKPSGEMSSCADDDAFRENQMESIMQNDQSGDRRGERQYAVVKRSVIVGGHKTSVSLEDAFWTSLKDIAMRRGMTLSTQIASIDTDRRTSNLSSAIRLYVLEHFRTRATSTMFIGERLAPSTRLAPLGPE
jgi:predicted DNA-binding ribbon-helix-helix protein